MAYVMGLARGAVLGLGLVRVFAPGIGLAQVTPEVADIGNCLCLQQAVSTLSAEMNGRTQALDAINRQVADLDSQLARERSTLNVNSPDAIARYKALL